ncbi:hypothetical protein LguiA_030112 [Lonicera macranthoides]
MDIDLLWTIGGWILYSNFMAIAKSPFLFLFLGFLLIVPLFARPLDLTVISEASSESTRRVLLDSSTTTAATTAARKTTSREVEAAAHEVPSGPNPESNK